ncbi:MAG: 7-cyano-7-deazaguanine synthase QueC [Acidobacteria bacterium]|nr:7-cyano-7-deazaguanine synthase QueC [Acidobacteriota bacterium]MBU4203134.1 7-cyano-7-deazaguanine synthase QueC [Acidobacteriota bacterium]MBU4331442.1 7-cyano-7-deazaguanine synthase QueC [Acidobacteriota bacterium]MBU4495217.1 7-cyano-7-deazaguanine synthase QueC [Acidobacteriota bacterium]MCG2814640.1 7-cyano-7-deazaguanine synthase QueC [Candidatus Aminicenantes bacterium]
MKTGIVLFSGGIDSTTALYWAGHRFERVAALTFDYGQRHRIEIDCSREIAARLNVKQQIFRLDLSQIGGSSLTDLREPLPQFFSADEIEEGVPSTYVPFRNGIFLSVAAAWADVIEADAILTGFNVIDSPHYPDTTEPFALAMEKAVHLGTRRNGIRILTPFIDKKKSEILSLGLSLGADYSHSISCYSGQEIPCGRCSSCLIRRNAWAAIGREDHLLARLKKKGQP